MKSGFDWGLSVGQPGASERWPPKLGLYSIHTQGNILIPGINIFPCNILQTVLPFIVSTNVVAMHRSHCTTPLHNTVFQDISGGYVTLIKMLTINNNT